MVTRSWARAWGRALLPWDEGVLEPDIGVGPAVRAEDPGWTGVSTLSTASAYAISTVPPLAPPQIAQQISLKLLYVSCENGGERGYYHRKLNKPRLTSSVKGSHPCSGGMFWKQGSRAGAQFGTTSVPRSSRLSW